MRASRGVLVIMFLCSFVSPAACAGGHCGDDVILAASRGDTVSVQHLNAEMNCCLDLTVDLRIDGQILDFSEGDVGPHCDCVCCFNIGYAAAGIPPGRYLVRVWRGAPLCGQVEVDVEGPGSAPAVVGIDQGECRLPTAIIAPSVVRQSWGALRSLHR